jgi:hypothetical protein
MLKVHVDMIAQNAAKLEMILNLILEIIYRARLKYAYEFASRREGQVG